MLKKYYGIEINEYKEYNEGIIFFVNNDYYYFTKCHYDEEYVKKMFDLCNKFRNSRIKIHDFVFNKDNSLITLDYILFKLNAFIEEIDINDIRAFESVDCSMYINEYIFMDKFWEEKIDYLELQLVELSDNKVINNSFDYFVGIGEILISYLKNNFIKESVRLSLSHRCLNSLNSIDYYNPLNITFDIYLKDLAAYIRLKQDEELLLESIDLLVNSNYYFYFFVRMVFPFQYFHVVSNIILDDEGDEELIYIVNNIDKYEKYLVRMETFFGVHIFSWIKKEE